MVKADRYTGRTTIATIRTVAPGATRTAGICRITDTASSTVGTHATSTADAAIGCQRCAVSCERHVVLTVEHQKTATSFTVFTLTTGTTSRASARISRAIGCIAGTAVTTGTTNSTSATNCRLIVAEDKGAVRDPVSERCNRGACGACATNRTTGATVRASRRIDTTFGDPVGPIGAD